MTTNTNAVLAQLRHLYANMMGGEVRDTAQTKRMAQGLLAPAIEALEQAALTTAAAVPPEWVVMVPVELANRVQESLGEFLMDHGWSQRDMDTSDDFGAVLLAADPKAEPVPAVQQGDELPREDFAWLVVQEACETEPADEDDPECIRILRRDLRSAVLSAFLRHDAAHPAAPVAQGAPRKVDIPPAGAPVADVCYAEGWNQACDAFFGGLPPQEPLVVTIEKSAPVAQGDAKDPLAGAAQWLLQAIDGCNISDLQSHLKIGFNRAERLMQDALAARSQAKKGGV